MTNQTKATRSDFYRNKPAEKEPELGNNGEEIKNLNPDKPEEEEKQELIDEKIYEEVKETQEEGDERDVRG